MTGKESESEKAKSEKSKSGNIKTAVFLQLLLIVFSFSGVCSKKAAGAQFMSVEFCLYYGAIILLLAVYAIGWQQVIKRLPLNTAYASKAITIVWGIIWGYLFFKEEITVGKVLGAAIVVAGVVLYAYSDTEKKLMKTETDGEKANG